RSWHRLYVTGRPAQASPVLPTSGFDPWRLGQPPGRSNQLKLKWRGPGSDPASDFWGGQKNACGAVFERPRADVVGRCKQPQATTQAPRTVPSLLREYNASGRVREISLLGQTGALNPLPSTLRFVDLCYLKVAGAQ